MYDLDIIAIVDDEEDSAEQSKYVVEDLGCETMLITEGPYTSVDQLVDRIISDSNNKRVGVLCDHRLTHGAFANFYGSALVAQLYKLAIPAILLTQFSSIDVDTTIREYRQWMPIMLARDKLTIETIPQGLHSCLNELRGDIPMSRIAHRTLIEIIKSYTDGNVAVAEAFIPGWNPEHAIRFPLSLMGEKERALTQAAIERNDYAYLFAEINIGATSQVDLFFSNFEWAEEPEESPLDNWKSLLK